MMGMAVPGLQRRKRNKNRRTAGMQMEVRAPRDPAPPMNWSQIANATPRCLNTFVSGNTLPLHRFCARNWEINYECSTDYQSF